MSNPNYTTTFTVDQTPEVAFAAINNPRAWWSENIDGSTDHLGAEFKYHHQDVHRAEFKITEFVPNQKVVWHVVDNYFNFIKDKTEWKDTDIVFEIAPQGNKTEVRFTHIGLVPDYECYDVCSNAWGTYITGSLRNLISTGVGQPNPIEAIVTKARQMSREDYTTSFVVDQSPEVVFAAVNNPRLWWTENIDGSMGYRPGAEFKVQFGDIHYSAQKIIEIRPYEKVVWHVTEANLSFTKDRAEWKDTDIVFEIAEKDGKTELRFTHIGLVPAIECYGACSDAWRLYINTSLYNLITTGKGQPEPAESPKPDLIKVNIT